MWPDYTCKWFTNEIGGEWGLQEHPDLFTMIG
jgi:hypothetical protein